MKHQPQPIIFAALVVDQKLVVDPGLGENQLVRFDLPAGIDPWSQRVWREQPEGVMILL